MKVGLPLKPVLLAVRRGRTIQVLCGLYDAQSRYYAARAQDKPPQFTISCNDREIGSGAFQCARGGTYGFSWRVPFTIFSGPLCIVASVDLGEMGHRQSQPVLVPWHWYDQLADFAGWALLGVLLVLVKENRNRQALTILIPFLLLSEVLWPWIAYLLALLSVDTSQVSYPYQWLAVTWTALWLMGPWLARFRPAPAVGLALLLAAMVGAVAELGLSQRFVFTPALMNYAILVLALLLALVLSGLCCRRNYSPRSFAASGSCRGSSSAQLRARLPNWFGCTPTLPGAWRCLRSPNSCPGLSSPPCALPACCISSACRICTWRSAPPCTGNGFARFFGCPNTCRR